jgi:hypothetical protein
MAWERGNGERYCHAWNPLTDLAMAPAAIAFLLSAGLAFDRRRTAVMLAIALSGPGLSLACRAAYG